MMDSPEPSKNNGISSASNLNNNTDASSSESPEVQESPFLRYVSTLSPITIRASHVAQGFLGLNSPPLVFKSPRISHRETQFMERPQGTQSLRGEISQTENGGNCLGEAPRDSRKSNSQQPLPGRSITAREAFDFKSEANTQNYSSLPSIDEYLADPGDIDQMYSADQDVEQSTDPACEPTQSKENILKFDRKDGPGDKAEESLPLSEDSNKVHQEKPAYSEELEKMEWEENDVEWSSQEPTKLESNLAADVFQKQYSHDSLPQDVKGCEDHNEMVSTSHVTAENISQDASEATLKYHGIRRRCLQFGEVASNALGSNKSHVKVNQSATSSKMEIVKLSEPITCSFPQQGSANFPVTGPKPSGIGLHLNSIINAMPSGHAATTGVRLSDGLQGMKSTSSISIQRMENVNKSILLSNVDGQSLADTRNESREIDASVATDSFTSESPGMTEPIDDKRKLGPIDAGNSEEFNQPPSPGKKKKKTSVTGDNNDGKPCNCKKSKCVKLYCDCFGAGSYCSDSCACEGCLNRPQYAETVSESKQQIESRNPNAFAPKIQEDKNLSTPASARHKRGCNCKRSMCAKKYCECYQANVGCSSGCRCEGCQNVHGKKGDYVALDKRVSSIVEKGSNSTFHNKLEMVASKTNYDLHCLSPITPSLQCSDQGKEAAKSRVISGNYLPCLESDVNMLASCANYPKSSANSHSSHALPETNEMLGAAPYDSQNNCNNANMMDQLSPTSNSLAVLLHLTPLSNSEPLSGAASFSSGASEWTSIPQSQLSRACIRQLPGGSLRWRSSPVTPSTRVGEAQPQYLQCPESDSRLFGILENETHYILNEASTPMRAIKVNSPTQKRISPPQSRHHGIGSCSSGGLRSGRKFILKSVPTFPPLTPCVDSKDTGNEELGDSES